LLGIRSVLEMNRAEQRSLLQATEWALTHFGADHCFSAEDLCQIHRKWLGRIYMWAGEYRQVNVSKSGFMFAAAARVPRLMHEFEKDCLTGTQHDDKVLALARTHAELLLIHPFREGNGRLARLLATLMALQNGFRKPSFEILLNQHRAKYFAAVRSALDRDYEPMRRLFALIFNGGVV